MELYVITVAQRHPKKMEELNANIEISQVPFVLFSNLPLVLNVSKVRLLSMQSIRLIEFPLQSLIINHLMRHFSVALLTTIYSRYLVVFVLCSFNLMNTENYNLRLDCVVYQDIGLNIKVISVGILSLSNCLCVSCHVTF